MNFLFLSKMRRKMKKRKTLKVKVRTMRMMIVRLLIWWMIIALISLLIQNRHRRPLSMLSKGATKQYYFLLKWNLKEYDGESMNFDDVPFFCNMSYVFLVCFLQELRRKKYPYKTLLSTSRVRGIGGDIGD